MIVGRLSEYFNDRAPWHLALWTIGTGLAVREVIEYGNLHRDGAHQSPDGLKFVAQSTQSTVARDPGVSQPIKAQIEGVLNRGASDLKKEAAAQTLSYLAERVCDGYLSRMGADLRIRPVPSVEATSAAAAAHLLDEGFSQQYLAAWLKALGDDSDTTYSAADILDEADEILRRPLTTYDLCIPFAALGGTAPDHPVEGWLPAHQTAEWLARHLPTVPADLRHNGSLTLSLTARDPWSAALNAGEVVSRVEAQAAVAKGGFAFQPIGVAWCSGDDRPFNLYAPRRARLLSLKDPKDVLRVARDPVHPGIDDAIEVFAQLGGRSRAASLTGGWAAIEALLLRPGESAIHAANRLASIVACAFPRAALTALSYRHKPTSRDALEAELDVTRVNLERCRILEQAIKERREPVVTRGSDLALLRRVKRLIDDPATRLRNVHTYVDQALRRLYNQRNLIMHRGSLRSLTLNATLRVAPGLLTAGVDRIVASRLDQTNPPDPLALAEQAKVELSLLGDVAGRNLSDLLT